MSHLDTTMKAAAFLTSLVITANANSAVVPEVLCFTSGGKSPIRFELRTYFDEDSRLSFGFVKYEKSSKAIPLVLGSMHLEKLAEDAPHEFSISWLEVIDGKISGTYEKVTQGTQIASMTYTKKMDGKKVGFSFDAGTEFTENGCRWIREKPDDRQTKPSQ